MRAFKIIILILNILIMINTIHFGIFAILPFLKKKENEKTKSNKKHKFMILIAARNEEMVIGNLVDSLRKQDYPKDLYEICVIPNNCWDNTKKVALGKKCMVIEPDFNPKTKGEVLNFSFNYFKDYSFDAYVIFDADNIASPAFLKHMNEKLNKGYKIVQGFRDTKNLYDNHITGSYALFFYIENLFIYESRSRINKNSTINGTGYVVLKDYINQLPKFKTSTEDIELTYLSVMQNEKIGFEEQAVFYDEQVTNFKVSMTQRKRWIQGSMQVFKTYIKDLLKSIIHNPSFETVEMFHVLYLPINQALAIIVLIISLLTILPLKLFILSLFVSYIGTVMVDIFLLNYYKKNIKKLWAAILYFPIFNICWIPLYVYSVINSKNKWEEIKHTKSLKIEDMTRGEEI